MPPDCLQSIHTPVSYPFKAGTVGNHSRGVGRPGDLECPTCGFGKYSRAACGMWGRVRHAHGSGTGDDSGSASHQSFTYGRGVTSGVGYLLQLHCQPSVGAGLLRFIIP